MQSVGVLICGYHQEDARTIKAFLDKTLDTYVIMVSASQKADMKIIDILTQGTGGVFRGGRDQDPHVPRFFGSPDPHGPGGLSRETAASKGPSSAV